MNSDLAKNGIYKITNVINSKIYIGSTCCTGGLKRRWVVHKSALNHNRHANRHLQLAWNKYGQENFVFEPLEIIEDGNASKGNKYALGVKQTEETKIKRLATRQKKSEEIYKKVSLALIGNKNGLGNKNVKKSPVYQLDMSDNIIKIWDSMTDAAHYLNIHRANIFKVCNGERISTGGYKWKYIN